MRFAVASILLTLTAAEMSFDEFKSHYGKVYKDLSEDGFRRKIYHANVREIAEHNAKNVSWTMAVNIFSDLTRDEFLAKVTSNYSMESDAPGELELAAEDVPDSIDWQKRGILNTVRKQGPSESCWAFSAVSALESAYALATGKLYELSEQQLCDCSGAGSCASGGDEQDAMPWYKTHGACGRKSYPYKNGKDGTCKQSACDILVPEGTVTDMPLVGKNAKSWKSALAKQPFTMGVHAKDLHQHYSSGVVDAGCSGSVDHAMLAVGYGTDGEDYFKIRNSWGSSWGENGYVRLAQSSSSSTGTACIFRWQGAYPKVRGSPSPTPPAPSPPAPAPAPSPSGCTDTPQNWKSSEGDTCSVYVSYRYCTPDGREGAGWRHQQWGPITNYADRQGRSAFDACCGCGGGSRLVAV